MKLKVKNPKLFVQMKKHGWIRKLNKLQKEGVVEK